MLLNFIRIFRGYIIGIILFVEYAIPVYTVILIPSYFIGTYFLCICISDFHPGHLVDEADHLDIGLKYCQGNYDHWNDGLTTLPGLYFLSVLLLRLMSLIFQTETCNIFSLRLVNYIAGISNVSIFWLIIKKICEQKAYHYEQVKYISRIYTINHGLFPVLFFLSCFYYSEPISVLTVILTYYLYLKGRHTIAACTGIVAIMVHQSNVVWMGFINMVHFMTAMMYGLRKWDSYRQVIDARKHVSVMKILVRHTAHVFVFHYGYTYVCMCILTFAVANMGSVVGVKDAHSFDIHIPQLLYFCLFYTLFTPCSVFLSFPKFLRCILSAKIETLLIVVSLAVIIHFNTHVHPYYLADNIYALYVFKQLYKDNNVFHYLLIPVYMLGGYSIMEKLKEEKTPFLLAYIITTVPLLVTQKIFEFRFYILPYLFLSLHSSRRHVFEVFLESIYYVLINVFTFQYFFNQEIVWSDDLSIHRFLW